MMGRILDTKVTAIQFVLLAVGLGTSTDATATLCCGSLAEAGLTSRLLYPESTRYNGRQETFFSLHEDLSPWCILQPQTTEEVSTAVKTLGATEPCQFAIRSGGHHHAKASNNIHQGVTIDLGNMNSVKYHAENSTTSVEPGAQWGDIYGKLDPMGLTVAGGRDASVGVAGLVLGGGNSFYSALRGMVCDGVRRFEVVLANGDVVLANKDINSDLFQVLKGGGNNFGIVTRLDVDTFETGKLWGGLVYYPLDATADIIDAFVNFADKIDENPASSSVIFWMYQPAAKGTILGASFANIGGVVMDEPHRDFWAIQNISSSMRTTTITDLTEELILPGEVYTNVEFTLTIKSDGRAIKKVLDLHDQAVEEMKTLSDDFVSAVMFQPIALSYAAGGVARGGNVLGIDRFAETQVLCILWLQVRPELVRVAEQIMGSWYQAGHDYAVSIDQESDWIYLGYAYASQDPFAGYGRENMGKISAAAKKYDPTGVFQSRVPGGFKISKSYSGFYEDQNVMNERDEL
ncbi:uncharacterized protein BCR38DRAFT_426935 [Pseudomassariella vexata]|uniref:FAD-binding PCMH-type domain-containing protein n=1 Tax=Pseudomassariella vexata TaxID=1141098 RepID=A0A1Y2E7Y5_9PEZI|nr:uncharacterized protein BCR38DRAFT_426935 [Pseudomassariella vexata]ORY67396.1 hypothetical protein BCR38DRAFT_426935 [Pseudomassariella vexata]